MKMVADNSLKEGNKMKINTFAVAVAVTIGFAVGIVAAPTLMSAGLSVIGAFSALILVMQAHWFVAELGR